jgi:hypothetical protein
VAAFRAKGGDIRQGILDSSALYLTAIIEYVAPSFMAVRIFADTHGKPPPLRYTAEYILAALGRVMSHAGQRLSAAGVQQLWDALSEDEALYEMLQRMKSASVLVLQVCSRPASFTPD